MPEEDLNQVYKLCTKCSKMQPYVMFNKHKSSYDGLYSQCKICSRSASKLYRQAHKDQLAAYDKNYAKKNRAKKSAYYHKADKTKYILRAKLWKQNNPEKVKTYRQNYEKKLRANPTYRINKTMRVSIGTALKGKKAGRKWEQLVGYTLAELQTHLEKQFKSGMTWQNYGEWHIDHIKPKSLFTFNSELDAAFKECWALTNLQPLWAHANLSKGAKYDH